MTSAPTDVRPPGTETRAGLPIMGFETAAAFGTWLSVASQTSNGIWLKLTKKGSNLVSVSKPDAIDAALCHGWIDGQQDKYDAESWLVRFTPRKRASRWSEINRTRAIELIEADCMHPAGLAAIASARADGRWDAAYAPASTATVPADLQAAFDASPSAEAFFATLQGANRYAVLYRIAAVKMPTTRARRIAEFVIMLERGETIYGQ